MPQSTDKEAHRKAGLPILLDFGASGTPYACYGQRLHNGTLDNFTYQTTASRRGRTEKGADRTPTSSRVQPRPKARLR